MKSGVLTLVADIGGTNARFALARPGGALDILPAARTADYPSMVEAIADLVHRGASANPQAAILAVAAPITGPSVKLTNGPWTIDAKALIERCGLAEVLLLNDFEAQALALAVLKPDDLLPIGGGGAVPGAPKLVLGPGTGLGCAALIDAGGWRPIGGEGGHVERNPLSARERQFWPHIEREGERVDAEQIVSGPGLLRLYRALALADGVSPEFSSSEAVLGAGLAGPGLARESLEHFAVHLGRYAGDLALVFMARGGVYLAGGMALRLAQFLAGSGLRAAFEDKPPYRAIMGGIATSVVVHPHAALVGLAGMVEAPANYAVPLAGRYWRAGEL